MREAGEGEEVREMLSDTGSWDEGCRGNGLSGVANNIVACVWPSSVVMSLPPVSLCSGFLALICRA